MKKCDRCYKVLQEVVTKYDRYFKVRNNKLAITRLKLAFFNLLILTHKLMHVSVQLDFSLNLRGILAEVTPEARYNKENSQ